MQLHCCRSQRSEKLMKMFDHQSTARRIWLRDAQAARITPTGSARQSNFEKSKVFRGTVVACLIFVVVNVFQDDPVVVPTTAYQVTV